jgi:hypothetical protein
VRPIVNRHSITILKCFRESPAVPLLFWNYLTKENTIGNLTGTRAWNWGVIFWGHNARGYTRAEASLIGETESKASLATWWVFEEEV